MEAIKEITLKDWVKSGEGANAESFDNVNDDNIMLKVAKRNVHAIDDMNDEVKLIEKVMKLNIKIPKMIEKVKVDGRLGIIYEKIKNKKSLGRLCHDNPEKISFYAKELARETALLHKVVCDDVGLKNYKADYLDMIENAKHKDKYLIPKMKEIIEKYIKEANTCIHGDLTVGNILFANNERYWIDLARMGYGDPLFDLAIFYFSTNILSTFKFVSDIFHMTKEQSKELWASFIVEYANITNEDLDELVKRVKILSIVFFYKIWATGRNIPIIAEIVHHNIKKYYKEVMQECGG